MIQRKQSLFLLLAVVVYAVCLFLPIASVVSGELGEDSSIHNLGMVTGRGIEVVPICLPFFLLLAISAILSLVNIFMYKNRKLQMSVCSLAIVTTVLWYGYYLLVLMGVVSLPNVNGDIHLSFAACLPLVAAILVAMAKKGVLDDENLVRAADRIR